MKTIIEMAREAGIRDCTCNGSWRCLERFAELVRAEAQAEEREACAKVCEAFGEMGLGVNSAAVAIRARGNT